jgi:hypothetical protein
MQSLPQLNSREDTQFIMSSRYWNPSSEGTSKAKEFIQRLKSQKKKAGVRVRELQNKTD